MKTLARSALALAAAAFATQAAADITLYEHEGYRGRNFTTADPRVESSGELAASVAISDNRTYEVCDDTYFRGNCIRLTPGNYPTLQSMNMYGRIASFREYLTARNSTQTADVHLTLARREYEESQGAWERLQSVMEAAEPTMVIDLTGETPRPIS